MGDDYQLPPHSEHNFPQTDSNNHYPAFQYNIPPPFPGINFTIPFFQSTPPASHPSQFEFQQTFIPSVFSHESQMRYPYAQVSNDSPINSNYSVPRQVSRSCNTHRPEFSSSRILKKQDSSVNQKFYPRRYTKTSCGDKYHSTTNSSDSRCEKNPVSDGYLHSTQQCQSSTSDEFSSLTPEEIIENEKKTWTRCAPADLYYIRDLQNPRVSYGTDKLKTIVDNFQRDLLERGERARSFQPKFDYPLRRNSKRHGTQCGSSCKEKNKKSFISDSSETDSSSDEENEVDQVLQELERKKQHPARLHPELWFNDPGEMNDGPLCRCRLKNMPT